MPTVSEILRRKGDDVFTVSPTATAMDAIRAMNNHRLGAVVVVDDGQVVGMFTERDVLVRLLGASLDPESTRVEDVMTTPVAYCTTNTPLTECKSIFTERRIRHLPVMEDDRLAGMVTSGDILAFEATDHEQTIRYLESYIQS
ncbi:MAG: CBS domain-containing protein [Candidatus Sumerlaeaceae bacterium]|nr:CBS domain-containing protein [Candidatus Sumerlaeaceae bacterium]